MNFSNLKIGTRLYLSFAALVAILTLLVTIAYTNLSHLGKAININTHTHEVIIHSEGILRSLINIETGQRGFALTGKETSLEIYTTGKKEFVKYFKNTQQQPLLLTGAGRGWGAVPNLMLVASLWPLYFSSSNAGLIFFS